MKTQMLVINASPHAEGSRSYRMFRSLMADPSDSAMLQPGIKTTHLVHSLNSGITADYASAVLRPVAEAGAVLAQSEALIQDLERSDALVILTPVHNLTTPAALKLWIDNIVRNERTFRSTAAGKVGLLHDRPTIVVITSGGTHLGPHKRQPDYLSPYVTEILEMVGICAVEFVHLQGTVRDAVAVEAEERDAETKLKAWIADHVEF